MKNIQKTNGLSGVTGGRTAKRRDVTAMTGWVVGRAERPSLKRRYADSASKN
jgi:hypothetical protein